MDRQNVEIAQFNAKHTNIFKIQTTVGNKQLISSFNGDKILLTTSESSIEVEQAQR